MFLHACVTQELQHQVGYICRSSTEVAGVGWDANLLRFIRQQVQAQWCCVLGGGAVLSLTGGLGLMLPWGAGWSRRQTCISDRCAPLAPADPRCRMQADGL
jgi:hypothetical protein